MTNEKADIYTKVTNRILADLEKGVRPWMKPWSAENAAQHIHRPLSAQESQKFFTDQIIQCVFLPEAVTDVFRRGALVIQILWNSMDGMLMVDSFSEDTPDGGAADIEAAGHLGFARRYKKTR